MEITNKVIIITGGASGIGKALAYKFAAEGAKIILADINKKCLEEASKNLNCEGILCDVTSEKQINFLIKSVSKRFGSIDMFVSNAGVCLGEISHAASATDDVWTSCWKLHVMSHVYAARALLPSMIARKKGCFLQIISAAALLSQIGDSAYSATKQAALGFAESLAISHQKDGIQVSVACPQYVATNMLGYSENSFSKPPKSVLMPDEVATSIVSGVKKELFLILPHEEVYQYMNFKSENYDKWITQMSKLRYKALNKAKSLDIKKLHRFI